MRKLSSLLLALLFVGTAYAQTARLVDQSKNVSLQDVKSEQITRSMTLPQTTANPTPGVPIGTSISDAVTSVKIGEASNAYTALLPDVTQLYVETEVGTNGGTVGYLGRQNVGPCGGQSGMYRFSYSTDGGTTWNVGSGVNTPGNPPAAGCYGLGPVNPAFFQAARYPNGIVFLPQDSAAVESELAVVYTGPTLSAAGTGWDGVVAGTAFQSSPAQPTQEDYLFVGDSVYFSYSLVERVNGEFWFVGGQIDGPSQAILGDAYIYKGVYNAANQNVSWTRVKKIEPDHYIGFDGAPTIAAAYAIGFSPDGQTGYVSGLGDLNGGFDTTFSVWFAESLDGGNTWADPVEVDLTSAFDVADYLNFSFFAIDTMTGDTVPVSRGIPTTGFDMDMVVDKNGVPHAIAVVGNATSFDGGSYAAPSYSIFPGLDMWIMDFTKDSFGDWNAMIIEKQEFFRGSFGTGADPASAFTADPWVQASRTADGSKVFFTWTDTDTANSLGGNDAPDLFMKGLDVDSYLLTPTVDLTGDDNTWAGAIITPKTAPTTLEDNGVYTIPCLTMSLDNNDGIQAVSFWYFTDATASDADFTEDAVFLYNCKQNPFSNSVAVTEAGCGLSDGAITVTAGGGIAPYSFQWNAAAGSVTTPSATALAAGSYTVIITDSVGCTEEIEVLLQNAAAPSLAADSTANISCNGFGDGYAAIAVTGGAAPYSYNWSNGETDSIATGLPTGISTLEVTDANNCVAFFQVEITEPSALSVSATATGTLCNGDSTGTASATALGGTGMIDYAWDNGLTGDMIMNIPGGMAMVTATDANGCTATFSVDVMQPDPVAISFVTEGNTGDGSLTFPFSGSISADVTGGTAPISFAWAGPADFDTTGTDFLRELCSGDYVLTATDANGCTATDTAVIAALGPFAEFCPTGPIDGIDASDIGIGSMNIFPNPSTGVFAVEVELLQADVLNIEIFNFAGQLVAAKRSNTTALFSADFDLSEQASGIYMIKVTTSLGASTDKIVLR